MAKERFIVFSLVDVATHILKLAVAWLLLFYFSNKLFIYTVSMAVFTAIPTIVYFVYCSKNFPSIVRFRFVRDKQMYKNVFSFSTWVGVGAISHVAKSQGAALVVNAFFDTIMNTAMGVASSINTYVGLFAQNITQPMAPQITKSYTVGNRQRTNELLVMSTKYSFLLTLLLGSVFLAQPNWLLHLWLDDVPPFASIFLVLFIVDNLVSSLNVGVQNIIFASGKIRLYQICVSTLNLFSVVLGFFVLRGGAAAYCLILSYIIVSTIKFFVIQWVLRHTLKYDSQILWRHSYVPSLLTLLFFIPILFLPVFIHPVINLLLSFSYLLFLEWILGLSQKERNHLMLFLKEISKRRLS